MSSFTMFNVADEIVEAIINEFNYYDNNREELRKRLAEDNIDIFTISNRFDETLMYNLLRMSAAAYAINDSEFLGYCDIMECVGELEVITDTILANDPHFATVVRYIQAGNLEAELTHDETVVYAKWEMICYTITNGPIETIRSLIEYVIKSKESVEEVNDNWYKFASSH